MVLIAYRMIAEAARWIAVSGKPFWPARWRVAQRLSPHPGPPPLGGREGKGRIWLHAASLGECKGLWALARELRSLDADFVLTANTGVGLDFLRAAIAKDPEPERWRTHAAPLDHPRIARKFLKAFGVRALVVFEVELWPHWFLAAGRAGVPVLWVSARWNARARRRWKLFPAAARRVLGGIAWTQAQSEEDAAALRRAGCERLEVGGDLRGLQYLDEAAGAVTPAKVPPDVSETRRNGIAFVSFHARELPALFAMMREALEEAPLIVFPRKSGELGAFRKTLAPLGFVLHSEDPRAPRRIVDRFGLVGETLRDVRIAVVGGSFAPDERIGGHNLWEPFLAGCRVAVGPHHGNQAWLAERLRVAGILRVIQDESAWKDFVSNTAPLSADEEALVARLVESVRAELRKASAGVRERLGTTLVDPRATA